MAMTKKDYELIAYTIRATRYGHIFAMRPEFQAGIDATVRHLATSLATENPRFDEGKFLSACEYGKMPRVSEVA
jgi:hypothetical protein